MELLTLLVVGLANGSLYALVGLGLVLVYNAQRIPNFGHGEFFMAGAFAGYTAYDTLGLPYPIAIAVAVLSGGAIGAIVEKLTIRPVTRGARLALGSYEVAVVMVTVGLSVGLKGLARIPWGERVRNFPAVFSTDSVVVVGIVIAPQHLLIVAVAATLTALLFVFLRYAPLGKRMRATAQNPVGAQIVGINTGQVYSATWALASATGAVAGVLAAPLIFLDPEMGAKMLLKGFAAAVLGGFGSIPGVIVGGVMMGIIEIYCGRYVSTALLDISAFLIIMLVLLVRPSGLFGAARASRV